jgi:DNA polymerase-1
MMTTAERPDPDGAASAPADGSSGSVTPASEAPHQPGNAPGNAPGNGPALLVDTYSVFFRAYHALPSMNTTSGEPTSALYGFSAALLKELREHHPTGLAFAVDAPQKTFRHEQYAPYKAGRDAVPEPLRAQFARLRELLAAFEVPVFRVPGVEADDLLATLARSLRERNTPALVLSGDRDLLQVARGSTRVVFLGARGQKPTLYDAERVERRFAVPPEQLPTWVALVGDPSDNLPGMPGVGPRTASKWVRQFTNITQLLARIDEVRPVRLGEQLSRQRAQLLLNEELAALRTDVPLGEGPLVGRVSSQALARLRALFGELEFKSLLPRLAALEPG